MVVPFPRHLPVHHGAWKFHLRCYDASDDEDLVEVKVEEVVNDLEKPSEGIASLLVEEMLLRWTFFFYRLLMQKQLIC